MFVEVVAGVIVALGTITGGVRAVATGIYNRGRKAEREEADKTKLASELEDLRKHLDGSR